jgi:predicted Zn-dependent peptidase
MKELRAIADTCPAAELEKAKRYLQLQLPGQSRRPATSPASSCRSSCTAAASTTTRRTCARRAVTQADVQRVARTYLDAGRLLVSSSGDRKSIEPGCAR